MKSLLVEDHRADARLICEMLKEACDGTFELQQVSRLDAALERLAKESFDLVLLDLGLPDSQGIQTLIRTREAQRGLPIVVLTGLDDERFALEAVRAGAQDYLVKGRFEGDLLVRTLRYAVERKRAEEEIRRLNAELEERVATRTAQLRAANDELRKEIVERQRAEQALQAAQGKLQAHAEELESVVACRTARLQETVGELEHFSYAIIHDMRAPLRAMQGFAEMLKAECAPCERTEPGDYLRRIKAACSRLDKLITDCLDYSKAVRQELVLEPISLTELLHDMVDTYPNLLPDRADIQIQADLPTVLGNLAALTQCFSNLLDNGIKFAKAGTKPQIRIWSEPSSRAQSTSRRPASQPASELGLGTESRRGSALHSANAQFVRVWVEDQGVGIHPASLGRIFGIFQRATLTCEGTGMGLAIVRKVVEHMGGEVGVESEEGKGSRFWVDLAKAP